MPVHVYRYSLSEAKRCNEMNLWRDSHKENIRCRDAIDKMVSEQYSVNILPDEIIKTAYRHGDFKKWLPIAECQPNKTSKPTATKLKLSITQQRSPSTRIG